MKPLEENEIFQNLSGFLKTRGIQLKKGSYAQGIQKSCALLTNAINLGQEGLGRAKVEVDKTVEHMRKVIHEKTAPKPPVMPRAAAPAAEEKKAPAASAKTKAAKATPQKRSKTRS
ncbi:MAG TPA: hypothetical protein VJA21_22860 [Verrucomicrobiae bacterium]